MRSGRRSLVATFCTWAWTGAIAFMLCLRPQMVLANDADMTAEVRLAVTSGERCKTSIEVANYAGASAHCRNAAEHWGTVATMTNGPDDHDVAVSNEASFLALAGASNGVSGEKALGRQQIRSARNIATRVRDSKKRAETLRLIAAAASKGGI